MTSARLACVLSAFVALGIVAMDAQAQTVRGVQQFYGGTLWQARNRLVRAARGEFVASEALLSAATSKGKKAQTEINVALGKLQVAKHEFDEAKAQIKDLAKHLNDIEREILDAQKPDSPYVKAKTLMDAAKNELAELEARLLKEGRYDERRAEAANAGEVVKLRENLLSTTPYLAAKGKADAASKEVNRLRLDLLRSDADWKGISDALSEAHNDEERAQDKANSAGVSRLAPLQDARNAAQVAAYARLSLAHAQAVLGRLGVKPPATPSNTPSSGYSSSGVKGKK